MSEVRFLENELHGLDVIPSDAKNFDQVWTDHASEPAQICFASLNMTAPFVDEF